MKVGDKVLLTKNIDEMTYIVLEMHKDTITIQEDYFYSQYECKIKTVPLDEVALLTKENITKYWENRKCTVDFTKINLGEL